MASKRQTLFAALAAAALASAGVFGWLWWQERARTEQIALGRKVYADHCARCHGARLEGQANWQQRLPNGRLPAPPHDASGHTWHHADAELFAITKHGLAAVVPGYESDMPAFRGILTDAEIAAVLAFIKSTWPPRERAYQERRSLRPQ